MNDMRPVVQIAHASVVLITNTAWNAWNFRRGLIKDLVSRGFDVVVIAPIDQYTERLKTLGCRFIALPMENSGTSPVKDLLLLARLVRIFRHERPDMVLGYTIKPNIYGSLAAHLLKIPVINNITGLGSVFMRETSLTRIVRSLYRISLTKSRTVFFQNMDDLNYFVNSRLVQSDVARLLPGSGVDIKRFYKPLSIAAKTEKSQFRFLLASRMLWDKGVGEYIEAARRLLSKFNDVEFCLLGALDSDNPAAISRERIDAWSSEGIVKYLGYTDDVRDELAASDCVVLPSYREGTPRILLEASAMELPVITTDSVGCREVVEHGMTGLLCKVRDADDLADKMERMLAMSHEARLEMGRQGRARVEEQFDEQIVIRQYQDALDDILYSVS